MPEWEIQQLTEDQMGRGRDLTEAFDMNLLNLVELATVHTLHH